MRQSSRCCATDSLGCLPCNFSLPRASGTNLASRSSLGTTSVSPWRTAARSSTTSCRAQPARRHRHPLEYPSSRQGGQTAETRVTDSRSRAPGPNLTPWMGPHLAHRRIPVAKAPIPSLAYDSAPYRSRPAPVPPFAFEELRLFRTHRLSTCLALLLEVFYVLGQEFQLPGIE